MLGIVVTPDLRSLLHHQFAYISAADLFISRVNILMAADVGFPDFELTLIGVCCSSGRLARVTLMFPLI